MEWFASFESMDELVFERMIRSMDSYFLMEYIRKLDPMAYARHFKGYRPQTLGRKRVAKALRFEIFDRKNETMGDVLTLLWNQSHRVLYNDMLEQVKTISEDVESIEQIEDDKGNEILDAVLAIHDPEDILVCVLLNQVRFSQNLISKRLSGKDDVVDATVAPAGDDVAE